MGATAWIIAASLILSFATLVYVRLRSKQTTSQQQAHSSSSSSSSSPLAGHRRDDSHNNNNNNTDGKSIALPADVPNETDINVYENHCNVFLLQVRVFSFGATTNPRLVLFSLGAFVL